MITIPFSGVNYSDKVLLAGLFKLIFDNQKGRTDKYNFPGEGCKELSWVILFLKNLKQYLDKEATLGVLK